jgi:diaminohydroxyphosphoribosylaminopyrimidine deaminase / 5-amino-6-(5-phosphoribosylamino)uracil reductase
LNIHERYMKRVLELAKLGWGRTNPNPLVGALIVKNGEVIAEGYHKAVGQAHAEVNAINNAKQDISGSTMYVNLEPCSHYGRTPPCVKAICEAGIKEVVISMADPNPRVSGQGVRILREKGISVIEGVLEVEAKKLNEIFIKYITYKKPFVIMKAAMTVDGKTATVCGDSKWISGKCSREYVHHMRDRMASVMVGIDTVLEDNPLLTTRLEGREGKDPVRIVADSKGRIPVNSNIIKTKSSAGIVLATTTEIDKEKENILLDMGVNIIKTGSSGGLVDLQQLMDELYRMEIDSVLLEGGGTLNASALSSGIVDKIMFFIAPEIIGGKDAKTPVEGKGIEYVRNAIKLRDIKITHFDNDILYEAYIY